MPTALLFSTAAEYIPRRTYDTVLHGIVREHLAIFLGYTERTYAAPLPKYVVDTSARGAA